MEVPVRDVECQDVKNKDHSEIVELKLGMAFGTADEMYECYRIFGMQQGFGVVKRTSKKDDGILKHVCYSCIRGGRHMSTAKNPLDGGRTSKIGCKAHISAKLCPDEKWRVTVLVADHNHKLCPSSTRNLRCNKKIDTASKNQKVRLFNLQLTGSFIDPLDEDEQSLITPIERHQANPIRIGEKMRKDRRRDEDRELFPDRDAAHYLDDMAPVSLSNKGKASMEGFRSCDGKGSCNKKRALVPSSEPMMPVVAKLLTQESKEKESEDDELHSSVKDLHGHDVHRGSSSSYSEVHTTGVELLEVGHLFLESVDATTSASSSRCSVDVNTSVTGSTSTSAQESVDGFEFVDNLKIPEEYETLYKKISGKHGHMATRNVIKFNDDMLLSCVASLLKIISEMKTVRGEELSVALLERWEGNIQYAEAFKFNIMWLRKGFNRLENQWRSSVRIDREVESHEQVLNATQVKYVDLWTRKGKLETELSEVTMQMSKTVAKIESERKAIEKKRTRKIKFDTEPVIGVVLD